MGELQMVMGQDVIPICQTLLCYFGGEDQEKGSQLVG